MNKILIVTFALLLFLPIKVAVGITDVLPRYSAINASAQEPTSQDASSVAAARALADAEAALKTAARASSAVEITRMRAKAPQSFDESSMILSVIVLAFGLLVTLLAANLLRRGKSHTAVLRVFGTILILVLAVFLVVCGYDDRQIAPVLGLLGTVAGYLLGSREDRVAAAETQNPSPPDQTPPAQGKGG